MVGAETDVVASGEETQENKQRLLDSKSTRHLTREENRVKNGKLFCGGKRGGVIRAR